MFSEFTYTYGKTLTLCDSIVPKYIINLFRVAFPNVNANVYALIQNVYCAKFVRGYVATGYWIFCDEETKDELKERYNKGFSGVLSYLDILEVRHNMGKNTPSELFIGKTIADIDCCEDCEPWCFYDLAKKLYIPHEAAELPSKDKILTGLHDLGISSCLSSLPDQVYTTTTEATTTCTASCNIAISEIPMTCVIETMCYCCT